MHEVDGINAPGVTAWLEANAGAVPPLQFDVVHGGRSNLTYVVTDADGRRWVLRRPPLHSVLESAHDMGREHRIISALAASEVPVPATVGYEDDTGVTGAPFYVMHHVDGAVVRDAEAAREQLSEDARAGAADDLVDVLARLHAVDPDDVGLGDLARREDYIGRQLRRWHRQLEQGRTRELPLLDEVYGRLAADIPEQDGAAIVHGDYRLDNLIVDPATGRVRAVLDWELTTLGDPLADLGLLLVYWSQPGDVTVPLGDAPTLVEGFPPRDELVRRYAATSGRDLSDLDFYIAFGWWKVACIIEGVYARYVAGAYGSSADAGFERLGSLVVALAERAAEATARAGR